MFKKFLSKYDGDLKCVFEFDDFYKDVIKTKLLKGVEYINSVNLTN